MSAQILNISNTNQRMNTGTISLGNVLGNLNLTLGGDTKYNFNPNVKKYEVFETTEDLLALSCAWYRLRQERKDSGKLPLTISNMLSEQLFSCVIEQDRMKANEIRDYYSKKLMVLTLKDQRLTPFRQDLNDFLHGDSKKFVEKYIPMVYRLPEFYLNDLDFDEVKREFEKQVPRNSDSKSVAKTSRTLTPVLKLTKNSKSHGKVFEYWMKDSGSHAYCFKLRPDNTLLGLWDSSFSNDQISLSFKYAIARRDDLEYFSITGIVST